MAETVTVSNCSGENVNLELSSPLVKTIWFNNVGKEIEHITEGSKYSPCYIAETKNGFQKYFIKSDQHDSFFSPLESYFHKVTWTYKMVSKEAFDLYLKFLQTRQKVFLTNAQRVI